MKRKHHQRGHLDKTDWLPPPDIFEAQNVNRALNGEVSWMDEASHQEFCEVAKHGLRKWPPTGAPLHVLIAAIASFYLTLDVKGKVALATQNQIHYATLALVRVMSDRALRKQIRKCARRPCGRYLLHRKGKNYCGFRCRNLAAQYRHRKKHPDRYRERQKKIMRRAYKEGKKYAY